MGAISKAPLLRRVAAWVLDAMLLCMLAVGALWGLFEVMNYDHHNDVFQAAYDRYQAEYETKYNISFQLTQEEYDAMTPQEKEDYEATYQAAVEEANGAMYEDDEAMAAFGMLVQISLTATALSILLAVLITEFAVPLLLKNGQTVGKKAFSIGVVRTDGVKAGTMQLLIRALLGKYTIETMIPVFLVLMIFWNMMDMTGTIVIAGIGLLQLIVYVASKTNAQIHDLMAGTVVVDLNTQRVFKSTDELVAYTKRIHAERAARQDY